MQLLLLSLLACDGSGTLLPTKGRHADDATFIPPTTETTPGTETLPVEAEVCDAGTEAWVSRVMPLVWGRRPHGAAEIRMWAAAADALGRETVVRAMTGDDAFVGWWRTWFTDALYVARTGDKEFDECFQSTLLSDHDGSLAQHIRLTPPDGAPYGSNFNMADVIVDALVADDVSVIYQAHLFARMEKPVQGANVSDDELEYNRRVNFGELFYTTYLGRNLTCMACHNSEFSTTDSPDPVTDRTWQMPGLFELALLGDSAGIGQDEAYAMFRYDPLVAGFFDNGGVRVWGMDDDCGAFFPSQSFGADMLGQSTATFVETYGDDGSVWQIERHLVEGADALAGAGLFVAADGTVGGQEAFAYLLAANIADQVWEYATGERLTIAHYFPRNEGQMVRLEAFADGLVTSGFSLRELLVSVATDPYFNAGVSCGADPYGMDPLFDPWSDAEEDPAKQGNGPGDLAHRMTARAILRSVHLAMGWKKPAEWDLTDLEEELQAALGVFLRESQPGFNGSDFQGLLAFEATYGACKAPEPTDSPDFLATVYDEATASGATIGDVVKTLKDRLVAQDVAADEQALIEDLLGESFATPVADAAPEVMDQLRLLCGTLLIHPEHMLSLDPGPIGAVPPLAQGVDAACTNLVDLLALEGIATSCADGMPAL